MKNRLSWVFQKLADTSKTHTHVTHLRLSCRRRCRVSRKIAALLRTIPALDFLCVIRLCEIESRPTVRTSLHRDPGIIELSFNEVQVAKRILEYSRTLGSTASMIRADFLRIFFQHHSLHRRMVQIAQRGELLFACHGLRYQSFGAIHYIQRFGRSDSW